MVLSRWKEGRWGRSGGGGIGRERAVHCSGDFVGERVVVEARVKDEETRSHVVTNYACWEAAG